MTEFLCGCGKRMLRQTTWFCSACDGMENPRRELLEARKRIAELEAVIQYLDEPRVMLSVPREHRLRLSELVSNCRPPVLCETCGNKIDECACE
jgi:hypothetical protein